ncbi:DUF3971 domain-containing protein [Chelativorans sp. M5D2P16]|uniref:YhdP family protein n=1 Tax=Chelativorans sp. M5D2P16 TaxID=3095678 RepID=UPI002ACA8FAC|nr:DUF3971 domain-containing protein [Chelativorans sp. M5D2P16]MDZ5697039.1 DUF3971 domain-containing protein [Chelativorans sp. M5D2P16]
MTDNQREHEARGHEEVHFRRSEIAALARLPSAICSSSRPLPRRLRERLLAWIAMAGLAFLVLLVLAGGAFYAIGVDAIGNERLRLQAERAISRLAGFDADVTLGQLRMGLGETSLLALEVREARISRADDSALIASVGTLRFGLRPLALLDGRVELGRVEVEDAEILPAGLPALLADAPGTAIGPDRLRAAVFGAVRNAFRTTSASGLDRVTLSRLSFLSEKPRGEPGLVIEDLDLRRDGAHIDLEGSLVNGLRRVVLEGHAARDPETGTVTELALDMALTDDNRSAPAQRGAVRSIGPVTIAMTGRETHGTEAGQMSLAVDARDILLGVDDSEFLISKAALEVAFAEGDEVYSLISSHMSVGRSTIGFKGTIRPLSAAGTAGYGFELVSRNALLAPRDSPEPALAYAMRLKGRFEPADTRLVAEEINIRTQAGEMAASAALSVPAGMSPGITLAVDVADMPMAEVKQFWPWFAAHGARRWTLENVFGGRVHDSTLRFSVPPGRLGNGVPLSHDELVGRFALKDTRFDIAGDIPAVRDGSGQVEFRGTDVLVGLESGTIYMPSGRSVAVHGGTMRIDAAHRKPRIGDLEIDIEGEAAAVVELASYEPIDASRFHDLTPADLSGQTAGRVNAQIPLQAGLPAEDLSWRVALDYENLSIAKPFEGQEISDANGSLLVQPDRAEFTAEARLNSVPASVHVVEPLRGSAVERVRHVVLKVDDAARERLFPGLETLVSGPFEVVYEQQPDKREKLTVSLDKAQLTVPWIGWRKGAGIPATARFFMERDGDTVELREFSLRGESFAVDGFVRLSGGTLAEARLDHVQLNRNDDYAATIRRSGAAYAVSVNGRSLDARGIIKRVLDEKTAGSESAGDRVQTSVEASLAAVHGFNGESLEQVELTYASRSSRPERLSLRAAPSGYGAVQAEKGGEPGRVSLRASSTNAGAVLRFLDIYEHVEGGQLSLALHGADDKNLAGQFTIQDFWVVDEPRLRSLVAASSDGEGTGRQVDASRVRFERGAAVLQKAPQRLGISNGVLRGPLIGSTFQGTLYDPNGNMDITGTFMPLYGINRIFGEIPIIGQILGNGRDRALIGITYRLSGKTGEPALEINPISAIAPGIFRQLFEYH